MLPAQVDKDSQASKKILAEFESYKHYENLRIMKSKTVAYLLWFFLGIFSAHRFYLGKVGTGILYLLTGQLFGIGWFIDLFILGGMVEKYNLLHGFTAAGANVNQNQNVVVNVSAPAQALPDQAEKAA